jgi:hypothetical protein
LDALKDVHDSYEKVPIAHLEGHVVLDKEGEFGPPDGDSLLLYAVPSEQLPRGVVALFGVDAIRELGISLDFVLANSGCHLHEARLLSGINLARLSTSREVLASPSECEPRVGASSTPEASVIEVVSDVHHHCPSSEGGQPHGGSALPETCLIGDSSDNMAGGESPTSRKLNTESPMFQGSPPDLDPRGGEVMVVGEQDTSIKVNPALTPQQIASLKVTIAEHASVFEGGTIGHRYYPQANNSTFYNDSQEAPDLA